MEIDYNHLREFFEAIIVNWLNKNSTKTSLYEKQQIAHETARSIEERYARETLSKRDFKEYLLIRGNFEGLINR